jgi:hypothetical protein
MYLFTETQQHRRIKNMISNELEKWFDVCIPEYSDSGRRLDVFAISIGKHTLRLSVEVIWDASTNNLDRDLVLMHQTNAQVHRTLWPCRSGWQSVLCMLIACLRNNVFKFQIKL